jgi:hypothetical protein
LDQVGGMSATDLATQVETGVRPDLSYIGVEFAVENESACNGAVAIHSVGFSDGPRFGDVELDAVIL